MKTIRVVAAAIVQDGRVLAARRARDAARGGSWELPGGKVEAGESDREALRREIAEELGGGIDVGAPLGEVEHDYGDVAIRLVAYACVPKAGAAFEAHEHEALRWLGPTELADVTWAPADVPLLDPLRRLLAAGPPTR